MATLIAAALCGSAALAGGVSTPIQEPAIAPLIAAETPNKNWTGGYVGLSYGNVTGDVDLLPTNMEELDDGALTSLFFGYQVQRGSLVYGGELSLNEIDGSDVTGYVGISDIADMSDLKGRIGYAYKSFLLYGLVGYSVGTLNDNGLMWDVDGMNYGLGVDYAVTDNWLLGMEYLVRNVEGGVQIIQT
jgi:opacity protein-like surface antigen